MNLADIVDVMVAVDCTREQIAAVVRANQEEADANQAERRTPTKRTQPFISNWVHPRLYGKDWEIIRDRIIERDGYVCAYCEEVSGPWCVDHIVPLSRGGSNEDDNLTVACSTCNSSKSTRLLSEWRSRP